MSPLEREIARQRKILRGIEDAAAATIVGTYQRVLARLGRNLAALTEQIVQAQASRVEVRPGWLFAQDRYRILIDDLERETLDFLISSLTTITGSQDDAVARAIEHGQRLVSRALGPAPAQVIAQVEARFDRLPAGALRYLVGRAQGGQPLGLLLADIGPRASQQVTDTLAYGVAAGKNPRVIAQEVRMVANVPLTRALTISRTEMLGAHRAASIETFQATTVVQTQVWHAQLDTRTCPVCWAMHGEEFPVGTPMESHPNCRCAWVPKTLSWADLGFPGIPDRQPDIPSGASQFAQLSEADRLAILGRARLDAYNAGTITLDDLVRRTTHPRYGGGRRVATVQELTR